MIVLVAGVLILASVAAIVLRRGTSSRPTMSDDYWAWAGGERGSIVRVGGVPVSVVPSTYIEARASYVIGSGPVFSLRPTLRRRAELHADAAAVLAAMRDWYRKNGHVADAMELVDAAVTEHVRLPMRALWIDSDGATVSVSMAGPGLSPAQIDCLVAIAAALASYERRLLEPLASALDARVETSVDGRIWLSRSLRVPLRIDLRRLGPERALATVLSGAIDADAKTPTSPEAADALVALRTIPGARVVTLPVLLEVELPGIAPAERVRRALDAMETVVAPPGKGPFR